MADTPVSPTNVNALPTAPNRNTQTDPLTYSQTADAWAGALPTWTTQVNNIAANVNFNADSAFDSAAESLVAKNAAEAAEAAAQAAQAAAEAASNATEWVSGQAYVEGDVVWSPITYSSYRANTNTSGATDPSISASWTSLGVPLPVSVANGGTGLTALGTANQILSVNSGATALEYIALPSGSEIIRVARTSNTALTPSNRGNLIDITSGTFTQTFNAAATLTDGWFCYIRNSGTGDITLDPDSSETIDGLTTYVMYPNEVRLVQCDGTAFRTVVLNSFNKTFTASSTFIKPPGYTNLGAQIWGGGGGGGRCEGLFSSGGGGGGACNAQVFPSASVENTCSVVIGSGGIGRTFSANGGAGGTSYLETNASPVRRLQAFGGGGGGGQLGGQSYGGSGGGIFGVGVTGGNATPRKGGLPVADFDETNGSAGGEGAVGFGGGRGVGSAAGQSTVFGGGGGGAANNGGTGSLYGGGGGGSYNGANPSSGGTSVFGGAGGTGGDNTGSTAGGAGVIPGGGGGSTGGAGALSSGEGARGEVRVWGVI